MGLYKLELSAEDLNTISFVGGRYEWSRAILFYLEEGSNDIPESLAWELSEAFDSDTEGGHSLFPLLAPDSNLYAKLIEFKENIV